METLMRLGKVDNETANTQTNQEVSTEAALNPIDDDTTETTPSLSGMLMAYFLKIKQFCEKGCHALFCKFAVTKKLKPIFLQVSKHT